MASLDSFEEDAKKALLDKAQDELYDKPGNLAFEFLQTANQNFNQYAGRHDYDIDGIPDSGMVTDTTRSRRSVSATIEWTHPLTLIYEYGADPHTISGDLAFSWESPPQGTRPQGAPSFVQTQTVNWGSVTGGIPESRAIRDALALIRRELK